MFDKLNDYLKNCYSPYSNFKVVACVITKDNKGFYGVNVENKSYGGTICAERNAINSAICEGYTSFKEIHILGGNPCFICRQTFIEFFDQDVKIFIYDMDGNVKSYTMNDMCPLPFEAEL